MIRESVGRFADEQIAPIAERPAFGVFRM